MHGNQLPRAVRRRLNRHCTWLAREVACNVFRLELERAVRRGEVDPDRVDLWVPPALRAALDNLAADA